jgi:hypothetical protein
LLSEQEELKTRIHRQEKIIKEMSDPVNPSIKSSMILSPSNGIKKDTSSEYGIVVSTETPLNKHASFLEKESTL